MGSEREGDDDVKSPGPRKSDGGQRSLPEARRGSNGNDRRNDGGGGGGDDQDGADYARNCLPDRPDNARFVHRPEDAKKKSSDTMLRRLSNGMTGVAQSFRVMGDRPISETEKGGAGVLPPDFEAETGKTRYDPSSMRRVSALLWDQPKNHFMNSMSAFDPDTLMAAFEDSDEEDSHREGGANKRARGGAFARRCLVCTTVLAAVAAAAGIAFVVAGAASENGANQSAAPAPSGSGAGDTAAAGRDVENGGKQGALPSADNSNNGNSETLVKGEVLTTYRSGSNPAPPFKAAYEVDLDETCAQANMETIDEYEQCRKLCEAALCCYEHKWEPEYSCLDDYPDLCDPYLTACSNLEGFPHTDGEWT